MIFWTTFINSLQLPKKKAAFALNRVGMDIVVLYMFLLLALVSIPEYLHQISNSSSLNVDIGPFFYFIYFFFFHYLIIVLVIFAVLSLIAFIATKFASLTKRKLSFSLMWKMAAFSTTIPFLIYTVLAVFYDLSENFLWLSFLYTFLILYKVITIYPKIKK